MPDETLPNPDTPPLPDVNTPDEAAGVTIATDQTPELDEEKN